MKFFALIYFCLTALTLSATEPTNLPRDMRGAPSNCIIANFDQIHITDEGLFVDVDEELILVDAIYSNGINQYRCHLLEIHNRLEDFVTCPYCCTIYDRYQYWSCPNWNCPGMH